MLNRKYGSLYRALPIIMFVQAVAFADVHCLDDVLMSQITGGANCKCCAKNVGGMCSGTGGTAFNSECLEKVADPDDFGVACEYPGNKCIEEFDGPSKHDYCPQGKTTDYCGLSTTYCVKKTEWTCQTIWEYTPAMKYWCECKAKEPEVNGSRDKCTEESDPC